MRNSIGNAGACPEVSAVISDPQAGGDRTMAETAWTCVQPRRASSQDRRNWINGEPSTNALKPRCSSIVFQLLAEEACVL